MITLLDSRWVLGVAALGATFLFHGAADAHFILMSPQANLEQGPLGDPQKSAPCGQDGTGMETGMTTPYAPGDTVTITIDERVPHPGHYRVALAINDPSELPPEPEVTADDDSDCGSVPIMNPPVFPVLADGLFLHDQAFTEPQSIEITLPLDVECEACTLQVLEFMSDHPASCFYHHCATISIQGGAVDGSTSTPTDDSGDSGDSSAEDTTAASSPTTDATATTASTSNSGSATDATATDATATDAGTSGTSNSDTGGADEDDDGCGCSSDVGSPLATLLGVLGLLGVRRRRASLPA